MQALFEVGLTNALVAALLGLLVFGITRCWRNPHVVHLLWVLVLVKLVAPPLVSCPWPLGLAASDRNERPATGERAISMGYLDGYGISASDVEHPVNEDLGTRQQEKSLSETLELASEPAVAAQVPGPVLVSSSAVPQPSARKHSVSLWQILKVTAMCLWLTGSVVLLSVIAVRLVRFGRCLQNTLPASHSLEERTRTLAKRIGLRDSPQVRIVQAAVAPMVWAVGKQSMVVLPIALIHRLGEDELDTVLMHELAHIRRRDHWLRWFELAITVLYWWNPVVWWARRELRGAEEACCDAWVQSEFPEKTKSYAAALLATAEFLRREKTVVPVICNAFGTGETLKRRVEMILKQTSLARLSWPLRLGILLVAALALPLSAQTVTEQSNAPGATLEVSEGIEAEETERNSETVAPVVVVPPRVNYIGGYAVGPAPTIQVVSKDDLQERVKTLEKQIESLLREVRRLQGIGRAGVAATNATRRPPSRRPSTIISPSPYGASARGRKPYERYKPSSVSSKAVLALVHALKNEDEQVRREAIKFLISVRAWSKEAVFGLISALKKGSSNQREVAATLLGFAGENSAEAVTALVEALADDSPNVRKAVIGSLGHIASPPGYRASRRLYSKKPPRRGIAALNKIDLDKAGRDAISEYDTNGDRSLSKAELKRLPAVLGALAKYDSNGDGQVSATEITGRLRQLVKSRVSIGPSFLCTIMLDGKPLEGATLKLIPERFLGGAVKMASGISDARGVVHAGIPQAELPKDLKGLNGVNLGLYKVEITHPRVRIASRYNTATTLGEEVAHDRRILSATDIIYNVTRASD